MPINKEQVKIMSSLQIYYKYTNIQLYIYQSIGQLQGECNTEKKDLFSAATWLRDTDEEAK